MERVGVLALLDGTAHDYAHMARPLLRALDDTQHFRLDVVTGHAHLNLDRHRVVFAASDHALDAGRGADLTRFVQRGGGLVLLHGTLAAWSTAGELSQLAGWASSGPGPLTELVVRPAGAHPLTARMPSEWKVRDELYLSEGPPAQATVLLRSS
ncbi:MAG TPA: ThuA domain-containing protein, partial [Myxococcaceae bacterium]